MSPAAIAGVGGRIGGGGEGDGGVGNVSIGLILEETWVSVENYFFLLSFFGFSWSVLLKSIYIWEKERRPNN